MIIYIYLLQNNLCFEKHMRMVGWKLVGIPLQDYGNLKVNTVRTEQYCLKMQALVAQPCPALCQPMDCSPPGSSVHGIPQVGILQWVAIPFSRGSS